MSKITINVPSYCSAFIDSMSEEQREKFFSLLFDIALRHRLLEYPTLAIEHDISRILSKVEKLDETLTKLITTGIITYAEQKGIVDKAPAPAPSKQSPTPHGDNGVSDEEDDFDLMR